MVKEKRRVAFISVIAAIFLTGTKLLIGLLTGSLGILSEALHSGLDLVAAIITYFSVRISDKPADREHNYGHGKFENFSAFIETILLLITCAWIIYEAVKRLASGNTHIEVNIWS
jgi:cation diffusion facilitator family transporter